jgi:hypothetical protein
MYVAKIVIEVYYLTEIAAVIVVCYQIQVFVS